MSPESKARLLVSAVFLLGFPGAGLHAADEKTLERAKKEGRVSFYTTMAATESKLLADAFQSKFPALEDISLADRINQIMEDYKKYLQ